MANRTIILELDEIDYDTVQREIAHRQARSRLINPTGGTLLPDGDSNMVGAIFAECCRDLIEYRDRFDEERREDWKSK